MQQIKNIFNYTRTENPSAAPHLMEWDRVRHSKDDVRELRRLLKKCASRRSATWHLSDTWHLKKDSNGYSTSSGRGIKSFNQRVMFKMTYSNSMAAHNKFRKNYMIQKEKDEVINKPERFGITDEEYESHQIAGHFKCIISPENPNVDLQILAKDFINRLENLTGYKLYWQGVIHTNTNHPHCHMVINRKDADGHTVTFPREMIKNTMRELLSDSVTKLIGPRSRNEIELAKINMINSNRWTVLDQEMAGESGQLYLKRLPFYLQSRLLHLTDIGLAEKKDGFYFLKENWQEVLKASSRYNTFLEEYLKPDNLPIEIFSGGRVKGIVEKVISFDKDETWNDAVIIREKDKRVYVPVYQLHRENLLGKYVSIVIDNLNIGRHIADKDIKIIKNDIGLER